jgi:hypothetical protein
MIEQICKTAITVFCSVLFINLLSCSNDVIIDDADKNIINASTAVCVTDLNIDENINGSGESKLSQAC